MNLSAKGPSKIVHHSVLNNSMWSAVKYYGFVKAKMCYNIISLHIMRHIFSMEFQASYVNNKQRHFFIVD
ncbi:unnamed protein product [Ceratitis capitata]|uniref:(Mediterranean fruit fly) hypothetical protein n=1 Tax=Ceratitis capitata TaxID=7213 RepID=A0A811VJS1_CERCA|nr:unnamed protein product [Ceratitis capitata]